MIQINDLTRRGVKVVALERAETVGDLGGNLDTLVERITDPMYAGGAVVARNVLKCHLHGLGTKRKKPLKQLQLIEEIPFEKEFEELLEKHGYESEGTADVAAVIAKELKLYKEKD